MNQTEFLRELQRVAPTLHLKPNKLGLKSSGQHPETLQVWDISRRGLPYYIMSIATENGQPREPMAPDIQTLIRMAGDNVHGGWNGWSEHIARESIARQERADEVCDAEWSDWFQQAGADRLKHRVGAKKTYGAAVVD